MKAKEFKKTYILCHYGEIALRGKNRPFFERKLVENIKKKLAKDNIQKVKRISGRILIELSENFRKRVITDKLKDIFGIVNFSFCKKTNLNLKEISKSVISYLKEKKFNSFKVETKRSYKEFPFTSQKINQILGKEIKDKLKKNVDLEKPSLILFLEILKDSAFFYTKKNSGPGGLPVGSSGRGLLLISGGIDSPVAGYLAQKRGLKLVYLHFHSYPKTKKESIEKVKRLIKLLNRFQFKGKVYFVPFLDYQKEILLKTKEAFRVILYRRAMLKIAQKIAQKEKIKALITGESLGQVASQTIDNLYLIEKGISLPVFRPLICYDKKEIIELAKKIGTYEISIEPALDCCQLFLPKRPKTKAKLDQVLREEKKLANQQLIKKAIEKAKIEII